jgi:hypothetical protein
MSEDEAVGGRSGEGEVVRAGAEKSMRYVLLLCDGLDRGSSREGGEKLQLERVVA